MSQHDNTAPDSQGPVDRPVRPPPMLLACPFCGVPPKMIWRRINPRGGCKTDWCLGAKLPALSLDRQEDIDAWNTRSNVLWTTTLRRFARQVSSTASRTRGAKFLMHFDFLPIDCTSIQY